MKQSQLHDSSHWHWASLDWLLGLCHSFTVLTALSLAPAIPLLAASVQVSYSLFTPPDNLHFLFCLFLILPDKGCLGGNPHIESIRYLCSHNLIWDLESYFKSFIHSLSFHDIWIRPVFLPLGVPALIPPLLILSKSYSIPYFGRRIGKIFLGSSFPCKLIFVFIVNMFLGVSRGSVPSFLPRPSLPSALDPVSQRLHCPAPSIILFLSLCQLLPLCVLPFCLIASKYAYLPFNFYFSFGLLRIDL